MIVPMKKVSLIVLDGERKNALKKLRKLGLLHIEIKEGKGPRLVELKEQIASLEKEWPQRRINPPRVWFRKKQTHRKPFP